MTRSTFIVLIGVILLSAFGNTTPTRSQSKPVISKSESLKQELSNLRQSLYEAITITSNPDTIIKPAK